MIVEAGALVERESARQAVVQKVRKFAAGHEPFPR
jgi:hypothetical protein